ncbi:MAG: hypothetical protein LBV74_15100 [Tannerella sp.]|nr:hypothetical protein [Tannerella sp.]
MKYLVLSIFCIGALAGHGQNSNIKNNRIEITLNGEVISFSTEFTLLYSATDPKLSTKYASIKNVGYSLPVWNTNVKEAALEQNNRTAAQYGDGFDDDILSKSIQPVTANIFVSGERHVFTSDGMVETGKEYQFNYPESVYGKLTVYAANGQYPTLTYEFIPSRDGYYSVGYTGAPSISVPDVKEIWQPMIWHEKRIPDEPCMSLAYRCPVPSTLVSWENFTLGVVANTKEFPFQPLPTAKNSRFGIAVRDNNDRLKPMLFAPILGGAESYMKAGGIYRFTLNLFVVEGGCTTAYERIGRELYGFEDYRHNALGSLNETLDNMIDYGMSKYSLFIDSLKGCNYSTDAPGAVKNVSSLNPMQIALLTGRQDIFDRRAYPMVEYVLSREKFLFCLDTLQKIQSPSRKMEGPAAPISELTSLYNIFNRENDVYVDLAIDEYKKGRIRNLDKKEKGDRWQNALAIYTATDNPKWLELARKGADEYLEKRLYTIQTDFSDENAEFFFWTGFTADWASLFLLYEASGDRKYLDAAHEAIRYYTTFVWLTPQIPDASVIVNPDGYAPHYAYLKGKGFPQMKAEKEVVEAWRVSEIGLTPESSTTSTGHRGIFMTNFAPWMMRIGYLTGDQFLHDIARSAVIGRYRNFPGYHMNTARTTVYEKDDYPYKPFNELSVNSFHFNHIWPHMNILTDYLVTDAFVKSEGKVDFPSDFVEGFAYLKSKFYGHKPGTVYTYKNVYLYMPQRMLKMNTPELNYIAGYNEDALFLIFTNQSRAEEWAEVHLDNTLLGFDKSKDYPIECWADNKQQPGESILKNGEASFKVSPEGITTLVIKGVKPSRDFVLNTSGESMKWKKSRASDRTGNLQAMILSKGNGEKSMFAYMKDDDSLYSKAVMHYRVDDGDWQQFEKTWFPFEFTLPLTDKNSQVEFYLELTRLSGKTLKGKKIVLQK